MKTKISFILSLAFVFVGCGQKKDIDKIAEAQTCLDASSASTATGCLTLVEGLSSEASYLIRCAAMFVQEGFANPSKLAQTVQNLKGSGASASTSVMSVLAFTYAGSNQTTNYNNSVTASSYCTNSGSKGLIMLATVAKLATTANYILSTTGSCVGTDMTAAMTCLKNNSSTVSSELGSTMIATYTTSCATINDSNKLFCNQFSTAITAAGGTSNPSAVANQFLSQF